MDIVSFLIPYTEPTLLKQPEKAPSTTQRIFPKPLPCPVLRRAVIGLLEHWGP